MKKFLILPALLSLFLLFIPGCKLNEQEQQNSGPSINHVVDNAKDKLREEIDKAKDDVLKRTDEKIKGSENAIQANVNSLIGGSIGKLGEEVTGLKFNLKDLVHAEANFETKLRDMNVELSNQIKLNNEIKVQLENSIRVNNEMKAQLESEIHIRNEMKAEFDAKIKAVVDTNAQAAFGFDNKLSTMKNELTNDLKAGHDVNQIEFNTNMLNALKSANWTTVLIALLYALVLIAAFIVLAVILGNSRGRAEARSNNLFRIVTRCFGAVDPTTAKEIAKDLQHKNLSDP